MMATVPNAATVGDGQDRARFITQGYLMKKGGGTSFAGRHSWKRRYFSLAGLSLAYFTSEASQTPKGVIDLDGAHIRGAEHHKYDYYFEIITVGDRPRKYCLACDTVEELEGWVFTLTYVTHRMGHVDGGSVDGSSAGKDAAAAEVEGVPSDHSSVGEPEPPLVDAAGPISSSSAGAAAPAVGTASGVSSRLHSPAVESVGAVSPVEAAPPSPTPMEPVGTAGSGQQAAPTSDTSPPVSPSRVRVVKGSGRAAAAQPRPPAAHDGQPPPPPPTQPPPRTPATSPRHTVGPPSPVPASGPTPASVPLPAPATAAGAADGTRSMSGAVSGGRVAAPVAPPVTVRPAAATGSAGAPTAMLMQFGSPASTLDTTGPPATPLPADSTPAAASAQPTTGAAASGAGAGTSLYDLASPATFFRDQAGAAAAADGAATLATTATSDAARAAAQQSAERLAESLRAELAAKTSEATFLAQQLDNARAEAKQLRQTLDEASVARERGAGLIQSLTKALTQAETLAAEREQQAATLQSQVAQERQEMAEERDRLRLQELEWQAERDALQAALASITSHPTYDTAGEDKLGPGDVVPSDDGFTMALPSANVKVSGVASQFGADGTNGRDITITVSPKKGTGRPATVSADDATLGAAVTHEYQSRAFNRTVTAFQPLLCHLFSTFADLPPAPTPSGHAAVKHTGADGFTPMMRMSQGAFVHFCGEAQLTHDSVTASSPGPRRLPHSFADAVFHMVTVSPDASPAGDGEAAAGDADIDADADDGLHLQSPLITSKARGPVMAFAQFVSGLVVFAQALLGGQSSSTSRHSPRLHKLITDWLVALAPAHVLSRLPSHLKDVDLDSGDDHSAGDAAEGPSGQAGTVTVHTRAGAGRGSSGNTGAAKHAAPSHGSRYDAPPQVSTALSLSAPSPTTSGSRRGTSASAAASSAMYRRSPGSVGVGSSVTRGGGPSGHAPSRSAWLNTRNEEGPATLTELSPDHRFSPEGIAAMEALTVDAGDGSVLPSKPSLFFSIDLPGVREVFTRDSRPLKSIFVHFATTRPVNFRNPYTGPTDRWTFDDVTRFAQDFRVIPGVVSMPQLLDIYNTVTGSAARDGRPASLLYADYLELLGRIALQGFTQRPPFKAPAYAVVSLFQWLDRSPGRQRMKLRDGTTLHFSSRSAFRP